MFQPIRVIAASLLVPATLAAMALTSQSAASASVHHHATTSSGNYHATTDAVILATHGNWYATAKGSWS
jgi:hypothetical protein